MTTPPEAPPPDPWAVPPGGPPPGAAPYDTPPPGFAAAGPDFAAAGPGYPPPGAAFPPPGPGYPPPGPGYPTPGPGYPLPGLPYPAPGLGYPAVAYPGLQPSSGLALASMICSLCGVVVCVGGPVGLVLGIVALNEVNRTGKTGRSMALTGIIVGGVITALLIGLIVLIIVTANSQNG